MVVVDNLEPGDFFYQADGELFLVVISNNENDIEFAVHGWRTIGKDRLNDYLDAEKPIIHTERQVESVVDEASDEEAEKKLDWLREIFEQYEDADLSDSAHTDFSMEDT